MLAFLTSHERLGKLLQRLACSHHSKQLHFSEHHLVCGSVTDMLVCVLGECRCICSSGGESWVVSGTTLRAAEWDAVQEPNQIAGCPKPQGYMGSGHMFVL